MTPDVEVFHFLDLLSLRLNIRLSSGLLPLVQHLSRMPLPALPMFPAGTLYACASSVHRQHPWLREVRPPDKAFLAPGQVDWALFWAWADRKGERIAASFGHTQDAFPIRPFQPGDGGPVFIIVP